MLLLGKEALIHYLKKYEPSFTWKVSLRTTALSMLTCIYISEQVLCQQFRTWTLFLLQCSLQPNLLALYFRRLELVAVSAREPSSSSFPTLNPHLTLQPAIPKRFLWRPLWGLPFEPQYKGSRSSTLPTLVFPEYKVLWTHEHVDVDIHLLKIKKTKLEKKHHTNPKSLLKSCQLDKAHWFQQAQAGRSRTSRWHCLCLCLPGKQAETAMFAVLWAIKTPVSFKGMTRGFPVLCVLLLRTELTTQIVGSFC